MSDSRNPHELTRDLLSDPRNIRGWTGDPVQDRAIMDANIQEARENMKKRKNKMNCKIIEILLEGVEKGNISEGKYLKVCNSITDLNLSHVIDLHKKFTKVHYGIDRYYKRLYHKDEPQLVEYYS
tara:strand:- start:365 stop:739 length:375 start_codon:yes stop_codon:yes gene_type:complete